MPETGKPSSSRVVEDIRAEIAERPESFPSRREISSAFYLLFSFDLVNSTVYKTLNPAQWPLVITKFYEFIEDGLRKRILPIRLWKYVGDELLLYKRVERLEDLRDSVRRSYEVMELAIRRLYDLFEDTRTVLSVKTTVWFAQVHDVPPADIHTVERADRPQYRNLTITSRGVSGGDSLDFLGPDIDIGFRIAKFSARGRLVVSADLAYLLYKDRAAQDWIERSLRIVSYEQLKGVWGNRHYPIVWYEPEWTGVGASFLYDEHHQNPIIERLRDGKTGDELRKIVKVFADLDLERRAELLWSALQDLDPAADEPPQIEAASEGSLSGAIELHCVAVCFRSDGRALVARREPGKRRFPGHWEFGCGQLGAYETFDQCLRRAYRVDFNAELSFDGPPRPVWSYTIRDEEEGREIPGIIFVATVENPDDVTARKHSEVEWISSDHPHDLPSGPCVPDLLETLQRAYAVWRR